MILYNIQIVQNFSSHFLQVMKLTNIHLARHLFTSQLKKNILFNCTVFFRIKNQNFVGIRYMTDRCCCRNIRVHIFIGVLFCIHLLRFGFNIFAFVMEKYHEIEIRMLRVWVCLICYKNH